MLKLAEYIWMDGADPTQKLRSKAKVVDLPENGKVTIENFPEWGFDGSSTYQATGKKSDLVLRPVCFVNDPIRDNGNFLVMNEVMNQDGTPHLTNTRAELRRVWEAGANDTDAWIGFEQEYTLFKGQIPLGWPEGGYPAAQGPFYCGVGADEVFGRQLVDEHAQACIDAGVMIYGINAEVMPGQWEFQIGYRGVKGETADVFTVSDQLWLARWILYRIGEDYGVTATLDPKPVRGDWNGAGMHTNFSTRQMREEKTGMKVIEECIAAFSKTHKAHVAVYGDRLADRLTGKHETCHIDDFRSGVADRGASVRIPLHVSRQGHGYIEDRRPGANADPYQIAARILKTTCGID